MTRMGWFGLLSALLMVGVYFLAPQELPVALWKLALITVSAFLGYWVDRHLFPYGRPDKGHVRDQPLATIRRAIVVAATMLAFALAL